MGKSPTWLVLIICALFSPARANAQTLPLLNMGYSGAGIGSDLLKVIERAGLWRKHGIDVRTVYLSSGTLMAQTLSSGVSASPDSTRRPLQFANCEKKNR
jgi:ABC-type nitrate/sulfonate/bicarbonate transport system substrate-binding protein